MNNKEKKEKGEEEPIQQQDEDTETPDDIVPEFDGEALPPEEKLKALRKELVSCRKEKAEYLEGWQRAKADLVNFRRRAEEDYGERQKRLGEELISRLLSVLDSFETAFRDPKWQTLEQNWREGMTRIQGQLLSVLKGEGLEAIQPKVGDVVNPHLHEPVEIVDVKSKEEDNQVCEVLQSGYSLGGKVIRPAKVRIGHFVAPQ